MSNIKELNNNWRRVATSVYKKPSDAKILGSVEVDVTELEEYVSRKRKEGLKITLTHILTLSISRALKQDVPELNVFVRRGKIIPRPSIDASVSVLLRGQQMGSVLAHNADTITLAELAEVLEKGVRDSRKGESNKITKMRNALAGFPWPFRGWIFKLIKTLTIDWGISIPGLGLTAGNFGSFLISNIGSLGLECGYPALLPVSNITFVVVQGGVSTKAWVVDGKVVPRRILWIGIALDHRAVDGSHGGKLFRYLREVFKDVEQLERKPAWCNEPEKE